MPTKLQKFAELLIRECIDINKQELAFNAFEKLLNRYQEHFGVEP
jgi:leucyl aminopeptidase (aminopeptidase T)